MAVTLNRLHQIPTPVVEMVGRDSLVVADDDQFAGRVVADVLGVVVEDLVAVQGIRARDDRTYRLAGLLRCGLCRRCLEPCRFGSRAAYRCRHGHASASGPDPERPKTPYVREDHIVAHLPVLYLLLTA